MEIKIIRRKKLRGFSLFEVILYIGLFSLFAIGLFQFSWNVLDLGTKEQTGRYLAADARFMTERINSLIRRAGGIDTNASVWNDVSGKLVLDDLGTGETTTLSVQDGRLVVKSSQSGVGVEGVVLHGAQTRVTQFTLTASGSRDEGSEYVGYLLVLESPQNDTADGSYQATTTLQSGAFIRNSGL